MKTGAKVVRHGRYITFPMAETAHVGGDLRIALGAPRGLRIGLAQALEAQQLSGEDEAVAGHQALDEVFLDLAQHPSASRADLDGGDHDDGAHVHAVAPGMGLGGDPVTAPVVAPEASMRPSSVARSGYPEYPE